MTGRAYSARHVRDNRHTHPRGGILLEALVSLAIFVAIASFTLRSASNAIRSIDEAHQYQIAADIARSKMSELEAGLINIQDLRAGDFNAIGSVQFDSDLETSIPIMWAIDVRTYRSEFAGLSLIELTVRERDDSLATADDATPISYTLRQLLPLRDVDYDEYEEDDILEGLPEGPSE